MKKLIFIILCLLVPIISYCEVSHYDSDVAPFSNNTRDLGTSSLKWRTIYSSGIAGGIIQSQSWVDMAAASSITVFSVAFTTTTLTTGTTVWTQAITSPATPRNITAGFDFSAYNAVAGTQVVNGTVSISGMDNHGNTLTEVIVSSRVEIAGNVAFVRVDTITINVTFGQSTNQYTAGVYANIGMGSKIGIAGDLNYATDLISVNEAGTNIKYNNASLSLNTNYDTINFVTDADASNDYFISFKNHNIQ